MCIRDRISLQSRAVALAVINAIGNVGSAVSPLLIGILRDTTGSFSSGPVSYTHLRWKTRLSQKESWHETGTH